MRPPISWSELASASVGVWGLGVEGAASLRRLQAMGSVPVLVEDAPGGLPDGEFEVLATATGGLDALLRCDVVVKSPGISRYRPEVAQLEEAGVVVRGGLGLWLEDVDRQKIACITGTKGKSTTTALAVHLLRGLGYSARAGGNIGRAPWDPAADAAEPGYWVIETSSFQVPDVTTAPPVVAVTSLSPDHLDWHGTVERYFADKLSLCTKPGVERALAAAGDERLKEHAGALGHHLTWVDPHDTRYGGEWLAGLDLVGQHNMRNAAMARAVLLALGVPGAEDDEKMGRAAQGFDGLPSRCRSLGHVRGVEFVDDSLSTNVLPVQAALAAYANRALALLVGGHDRGLDYTPLARSVAERQLPTLVVTMPDNGPRIGQAVRAVAGANVEVVDADDLAAAVAVAYGWAPHGGVVLLSPGAPSFGLFANYADRAQAFAAAAAALGPLS
jgi:UDP-N-acetylmuramoylalanine--D-glutamate ligase